MYKEYTCISRRNFNGFKAGEKYTYRILYEDIYAIFYHDIIDGSFKLNDKQFPEYFETLAEYRDEKINEILWS